ncbi:hypothetical protein [Microvirga massiliensis]|uniref:hypothetical protein n=1 Tax=Microvirga massiliensis TaxID=1033741 RepID=UPI00062B5E10|nr:hypothetical protein [Microvirga massiliensis]
MAYGKGTRTNDDKRMIPLGTMAVDARWLHLRSEWIAAANLIAERIRPTVLEDLPSGKALDAAMLAAQAELKGRLNSVWAEKARITAKSAVIERHKRARANLFGRFRHIDTVGDRPCADGTRRLVNLPEEWSQRLSDTDVAALKTLAEALDFQGTMAFLQKVQDGRANIPSLQAEALRALVATVEQKFRHPSWQESDDTVVQLHLDYRCVPASDAGTNKTTWRALTQRLTEAVPAVLVEGKPARVPVLVAAPVARQAPLVVRAVLRREGLRRLLGDKDPTAFAIGSLCLEISKTRVAIKGVVSKTPRVKPLAEVTHLVGRDFGYRNTVALAVVAKDGTIDPGLLTEARTWGKQRAKQHLSDNIHAGAPVAATVLDGADFLKAIAGHCERIDALRSEIDRTYNRIQALKANINRLLGHAADALVDLEQQTSDAKLAAWLKRLRRLLAYVGRLKEQRRRAYRAIEGIKKSWFGYVSSQELELARTWNAAVVREDLTVVAEEKESPTYKGRTFNKMIAHGAKGQYIRRASDKLRWNGIPEVVVPSFWTSCTDVRFGVVDTRQRRGAVFTARADGACWDADLHAAQTLALWPVLRPKSDHPVALAA